jgi:RimJ/RimL family protein N-acetyltransferase
MNMVFDFNSNYILEDEIVRLRPLLLSDYDHLLDYSLNEPEIWQLSLTGAAGPENLKNYLITAIKNRTDLKEYAFIVFDKRKNRYVGSTRFYDIQLNQEVMQLGYTWYAKEAQGSGLNKHCKYLLMQFFFEKLNFFRLEFRANYKNERSIRAMKSIGCKVDGVLRQNLVSHTGERRDTIVLSILKEEWFNEVKEMLGKKLIV